MESSKNKVTTKQQFKKLVELMEKYPETGRGKLQFGSSKNKSKELWEEFALELNSLGPPSRSAQEWGRVWVHYKANFKRKLANNRNNFLATGGGPSQEVSLTPLEESVAELIQIREQVSPAGRSFGVENTPPAAENSEREESQIANPDTNLPTSSGLQGIRNRRKDKNLETERLELLKGQAQTQKDILTKIAQLEKSVHKNYEINKKMLEIKKQKHQLYKLQAKEATALHALKVEVQKLKIAKMQGNTK